MATKPKTPAARRKEAEHRVAELTAKAEAFALEKTVALLESPQPVVVPWSEYPAFDQFGQGFTGWERPYLWSSPEDRTEGRYRPYYETAQDLQLMRATGRRMQALFPVAEGALEALTNYVIGEGFTFTAQPKRKEDAENEGVKRICAMVQKVVDRFLEYNNFTGAMDREIHIDSRTDGEAFLTLYNDVRDVRVELVNPDYILQPLRESPLNRMCQTSHKINYWWHGVHTTHCLMRKRDDTRRPLGYHAVFDRTGEQWDYLPSARVEHIKLNVGSEARRGVSDFYIVQRDIEHEAKIRRNTAEGAAILAAIVMIRQHAEGVTRSGVESMVSDTATRTYQKPIENGTRTTNVAYTSPGTVKDIPHGMTAMFGPLGTLNQPIYMEVGKYLLRTIWQRWNAPDFMTGDATSQNYATSLVTEAPFVKARENDQRTYGQHFVRMIWKALRIYHEAGALGSLSWEQIRALVQLKGEYPEVASRDKKEQAEVNKILSDGGILSDRTWTSQSGLDYDEEQQEIKKQPKKPAPDPMAGGAPGAFGGFNPQKHEPIAYRSRTESLAVRAIDLLMERTALREKDGRWVTLDNGVHVNVDEMETLDDAISELDGGNSDDAEDLAISDKDVIDDKPTAAKSAGIPRKNGLSKPSKSGKLIKDMTADEYIQEVSSGEKVEYFFDKTATQTYRGSKPVTTFTGKDGKSYEIRKESGGFHLFAVRDLERANGAIRRGAPPLQRGDVKSIGYIKSEGKSTFLAISHEARGKGLGEELQFQYRLQKPWAKSGGFSEAGERTARKVFARLQEVAKTAKESGGANCWYHDDGEDRTLYAGDD